MSDIFISYARASEAEAHRIADVLRSMGYGVWRDDELPAHRSYGEVIEERLRSAKAVLVLWSVDAAKSQWVRAEADAAREAGTLVQVSVDGGLPPLPFNQIQCADLAGWKGDTTAPGWRKIEASISSLVGGATNDAGEPTSRAPTRRVSICVLPFINMSGDAEQEYFSDGISEDIITDLSKVSALSVVARNTAFAFKGKSVDVKEAARSLNVSHVLEGSVRKAGARVRITAQLIDGKAGDHLWAERYDRDLTDIFAIQDEISKAIVGALRLKLLPREKKAIEHRGTTIVEAYNLYLMARQSWISGSFGDRRRDEVVVRICRQAIALDPNYARAWALIALAQCELRFWHGGSDDALAAAERALSLDQNLPEALCVKARYLDEDGRQAEANRQIETALRLDPESWEVNREAARIIFRQGRAKDAIPYFEKAASLMSTDFHNATMLITCYQSIGDRDGLRRAAQMTVERGQKVAAEDPSNGAALAACAVALATLGEADRAKEWISRALIIDPDNISMRYNLACALSAYLRDTDEAIKVLGPFFDQVKSATHIKHLEVDPDMDPIRDDPRFQKMLADAKARLAAGGGTQAD